MRLSRGVIGRNSANPLKFSADLTSTEKTLAPSKGIGPGTASGGGQNIPDYQGVYHFIAAGNPAVPGSRIVGNLCYDKLLDGPAISGIKGCLSERASTNKCTNYNTLTESYGATQSSGFPMVKGRRYEIVARTTLDFTTVGAVNNTVGTQFVATSATAIGAGDQIKEVVNGVGTIATSTSTAAIPSVTLGGDAAATATIVDDSAALAAAGLSQLVASGRVLKLDNSAGATAAYMFIAGSTSNTNPHSMSAFVRAGSGSGKLMWSSGVGQPVAWANSAYILSKYENSSPDIAGRVLTILANSGSVVYITLNQLEELPFATSNLITSGATATRAITADSYPSNGNLRPNEMSGKFTWTPAAVSQGTVWVFGSYTDANNGFGVLHDGTNIILRKRIAGVNYDATKALAVVAGTSVNIGWRIGSAGMAIFVNSVKGTTHANSQAAVLGATFVIGNNGNGSNAQCGQIKDFRVYYQALSDGGF